MPVRKTLKEPVKKCLKASNERGIFQILPTDGARACMPIGLDRRQLGLVREKG